MTQTPLTVAFHIGVHKTATTHLQRSLKYVSEQMAATGVHYHGPDTLRLPGRSLQSLFGLKHQAPSQMHMRPAADQLMLLHKGGHRLVLSEENFIGPLNQPKGGKVKRRYKVAGERLTRFSNAIGQPIDVFIAIRRPTGFVNSAYCQMLLGGQVQPLAVYKRRQGLHSVDWFDLISRLRAAQGVRRLVVWRYEDYRDVFPQIATGLVGEEAASILKPRRRHINRGLSADAVDFVLQIPPSERAKNSARLARKAMPVEDGYVPFDGFSAEEHSASDTVYAQQVAKIAQIEGVTLLRPDQT